MDCPRSSLLGGDDGVVLREREIGEPARAGLLAYLISLRELARDSVPIERGRTLPELHSVRVGDDDGLGRRVRLGGATTEAEQRRTNSYKMESEARYHEMLRR